MERNNSKRKLSIYWKIGYIVSVSIVVLLALLMVVSQLPSEYEILFLPIMLVFGFIGIVGTFVGPFLASRTKNEEVMAILDKVENWEPVIQSQLDIKDMTIESVYKITLDWLNTIGAEIKKVESPRYVRAFHEIYDSSSHGIGQSVKVENWEKFFEFSLTTFEESVKVILKIHQGWVKTALDRYRNRKRIWRKFVEEYSSYSDAIIYSIDEISQSSNEYSFISELFMPRDSLPLGIGGALFFLIIMGSFMLFSNIILTVNSAMFVIGLVFILAFVAIYKAVTS